MSHRREFSVSIRNNFVTISVTLVIFIHPLQATQGTFLCHKDLCTRGVHFCADDMRRCELCIDRKSACETTDIPRDCDAFCSNLKAEVILEQLNNSVTEKRRLQQQNGRLSASLEKSKKEKETLETKLKNLKDLNLSLNSSLLSKHDVTAHLQRQLNQDKSQLQECSDREERLKIALATVSTGLILSVLTVFGVCVCRRRRISIGIINDLRALRSDDKEEKASLSPSSSDVESVYSNPESDDRVSTVPVAEEAGQPFQDARLMNVPPTSPDGSSKPVYD